MKTSNFYTILILVFSALITILVVFPQYQNWKFATITLKTRQQEATDQDKYFEEVKKTSRTLENYQTAILKINTALPDGPKLPELLNFIQKLASQTGLLLKKIGTIETREISQSKLKETKIEISLSGSYESFKNFLSVLQRSARLIEVENIVFNYPPETPKQPPEKEKKKPEEGEEIKIFEFNLKIKVYHY